MPPVSTQPSLDQWRGELAKALEGPLRGAARAGEFSLLRPSAAVADDAMKLLIKDARGRPMAVALCSPRFAPDGVAGGYRRARAIREALGPKLAVHVAEPLHEGQFQGLSYAILPFYQSLSGSRIFNKLQRMALTPCLFEWLREAARATRSEPAVGEADQEIVRGLEALEATEAMPPHVRTAAETGLNRLRSGLWSPRRVVMHGDLWLGNVMYASSAARADQFVVIDWGTSRVDGLPFDDLVRIGHSLGVSARRLRGEVFRMARILDCDPADARSHLAASLGVLGFSLNEFPFDNYVALARYAMDKLDEALVGIG